MDEADARALELYRQSIADTAGIGHAESIEILEALMDTDSEAEAEARELLFRLHRPLVYRSARTLARRFDDVGVTDLIDAGTTALVEAVSVFEPSSIDDGIKFSALAQQLIQEAMLRTYGDDASGGGLAGDREPRRPHPPTDTLGAERDHP